jgi:hypothetical protein
MEDVLPVGTVWGLAEMYSIFGQSSVLTKGFTSKRAMNKPTKNPASTNIQSGVFVVFGMTDLIKGVSTAVKTLTTSVTSDSRSVSDTWLPLR